MKGKVKRIPTKNHEVTPATFEYDNDFAVSKRKLKLIKFYSEDCGICHKMSFYDKKVAKKFGIEFVSVPEMDDELWDEWVHVAEPLYEDTDGMGWPIYILVNHASPDDFEIWGEVKGGSDKGKFKRSILELIETVNLSVREDCTQGIGGDTNGHCVPQTCDNFKWDCHPESVQICDTGCYDIYWSTHGCNSCKDENGTEDLEYQLWIQKPGGNWQLHQDWQRQNRYTLRPGANAKVGDEYEMRVDARCNDWPGGRQKISANFKLWIKECKDGKPVGCKSDEECPAGKCCNSEGNCVNCDDPGGGKPDFPGDCNDGKCKNSWWLDMECVYDKLGLGTVGVRDSYTAELEKKVEYLENKIAKFETSFNEMVELRDVFLKSKLKES